MMNGIVFSEYVALSSVSSEWRIAGAGNFNGNGSSDLAWENTTTGARALWLMNGTVFEAAVPLPTVSSSWEIANR